MSWKNGLSVGEVAILDDFLGEVPTDFGARGVVEGILNKIAEGKPKWRYLFLNEDGDITGSNDASTAQAALESEDMGVIVIGVVEGVTLEEEVPIEEQEDIWSEEQEEDDLPGTDDEESEDD